MRVLLAGLLALLIASPALGQDKVYVPSDILEKDRKACVTARQGDFMAEAVCLCFVIQLWNNYDFQGYSKMETEARAIMSRGVPQSALKDAFPEVVAARRACAIY
jgi:hypothetical protein